MKGIASSTIPEKLRKAVFRIGESPASRTRAPERMRNPSSSPCFRALALILCASL